MKKTIILVLTLFSSTLLAQNAMEKSTVKKIEVTGYAEMEVIPDEIYFSISLKEYFKDEKQQKDKTSIDALERQLVKSIEKAGIAKENLTIGGIYGYKNYSGRKKPQLFLESKQYVLKLSNLYKIDRIMADVDERGIEYANVQRVEHSKITELKKDIKKKALQAAKEKATYLLEAINEGVGEVLEVREIDDQFYYPQPVLYAANARMAMADVAPVEDSNLEYQKIKISYKMAASFRIK